MFSTVVYKKINHFLWLWGLFYIHHTLCLRSIFLKSVHLASSCSQAQAFQERITMNGMELNFTCMKRNFILPNSPFHKFETHWPLAFHWLMSPQKNIFKLIFSHLFPLPLLLFSQRNLFPLHFLFQTMAIDVRVKLMETTVKTTKICFLLFLENEKINIKFYCQLNALLTLTLLFNDILSLRYKNFRNNVSFSPEYVLNLVR